MDGPFPALIGRAVNRLRHSPPVNRLRYHVYRTALSWPRRRECNLCGWRGRRFLTYHHRHVLCPRCGSQIRHRLIAAALAHAPALTEGLSIDGATVLHMSPEYCLVSALAPRARRYFRADLATADADVRMDATHMPFKSGRFDVAIACDVLEHIADDRSALAEMHRALRPGGVAVLTVPTADGARATFEDPSIVTPDGRERAYGQSDHVRLYGADFVQRIEAAGFAVAVVTSRPFSARARRTARAAPRGAPPGALRLQRPPDCVRPGVRRETCRPGARRMRRRAR